jgi:hypothetical protein
MIWIKKNHVNMTNQSQSHDLAKKRTCESAKRAPFTCFNKNILQGWRMSLGKLN